MDVTRDKWYRLHGILCKGHVVFGEMSVEVV